MSQGQGLVGDPVAGVKELYSGFNPPNYRIIAAALRNTGGVWNVINSGGHRESGIASVVTNVASITINYSFTASNVASLIVVTDETLALGGYTVGASAGLSSADITIVKPSKTVGCYAFWSGAGFTLIGQGAGNFSIASFTAGVLTLNHDSIDDTICSVVGRGGVLVPQAGGIGATTTAFSFYDWAGVLQTVGSADMKAYVSRSQHASVQDPSLIGTTPANLWVYGVFEL